MNTSPLIMAVPKGRIQDELVPLLKQVGIEPEDAFFDEKARQLQFACKNSPVKLIRVRSFDVATFVAFGAAQIGVAGSDVLMEFDYPDIYTPLDLKIGFCRLSLACIDTDNAKDDLDHASHVRVATKYPSVTRRYFADQGIQAECIKLSGAMELAPKLGLANYIVDLVSSGRTLQENNLKELSVISQVSSRLIVGRAAFKTRSAEISNLIQSFREVVYDR
ncbi:MAG: ATP phosphoribosyltransferase [Alphaproteobacteria bacterium]